MVTDIRPLFDLLFGAWMGGLMPMRKRGVFGTPDDPVYLEEGQPCPWWIEARYPLNLRLTMACDCETYFEDGSQVVRPIHREEFYMLRCIVTQPSLINGAPTVFLDKPRSSRPRIQHGEIGMAV